MTFETEDVPFAGTDATVYVQLFGEKGQTEKIEFRSEDKKEAPKFKRGRIDKFAVETADVGKVNRLDWLLNNPRSSSGYGGCACVCFTFFLVNETLTYGQTVWQLYRRIVWDSTHISWNPTDTGTSLHLSSWSEFKENISQSSTCS